MHARKGQNAQTEAGRKLNRAIRRHRVVIEFLFGSLKKRFSIVRQPWPRAANRDFARDVFYCCCLLQNFWMRKYGYLRGEAFRLRRTYEIWEEKLLQHPHLMMGDWDDDDCVFEAIFDGSADDLLALMHERGIL